MIIARSKVEQATFEEKMQMLAWQTSLLMNATGNFKKKIKPSDLYSTEDSNANNEKQLNVVNSKDLKKQLQEELLSTFSDSDKTV